MEFTNKIEGIMRDFIINEIAGDTVALRKEVSCLNIIQIYLIFIYIFLITGMYGVIKDNMKKKSLKKTSKKR